MTTFFEHQRTSFKRNYLSNLIAVAASDGHLDENERVLIHKIGLKRGLKEWQINELLEETASREAFIPESIYNRMELLYDLMLIIYADEKVSAAEVIFITNIVHVFQFRHNIVDQLIDMFSTSAPDAATWKEFVKDIVESTQPRPHTIL